MAETDELFITEEQANELCAICGHPRGYHPNCEWVVDIDGILEYCRCPEFKKNPQPKGDGE